LVKQKLMGSGCQFFCFIARHREAVLLIARVESNLN
jgi:hypothetical protein